MRAIIKGFNTRNIIGLDRDYFEIEIKRYDIEQNGTTIIRDKNNIEYITHINNVLIIKEDGD